MTPPLIRTLKWNLALVGLAFFVTQASNASPAQAGEPGKKPAKRCQAAEAKIDVVGYRYRPVCGCEETDARSKTCTVAKGTRVTWRFADEDPHDTVANSDRFPRSARIKTGTHSHTFEQSGRYEYFCSLHRSMRGYAIVVR